MTQILNFIDLLPGTRRSIYGKKGLLAIFQYQSVIPDECSKMCKNNAADKSNNTNNVPLSLRSPCFT